MYENCQFCSSLLNNISKKFLVCQNCAVIFNLNYQVTSYEDSYFENEYKNQYGKSYIDDKINLQKKMAHRLEVFKKYFKNNSGNKKLLEIGSAAGFFIELARESGFDAEGWEVSKYMSDFANQNGNKTTTGDFIQLLDFTAHDPYNVIAAFYVIEHFSNPRFIWGSLSKILMPKGYLLLAIPCISGPLYTFHRLQWLKTHPKDHYMDYSHKGIKKISSMFGFKILHMEAEGLHPERFPLGNFPVLRQIYKKIQQILAYSDTIYVVLQKI